MLYSQKSKRPKKFFSSPNSLVPEVPEALFCAFWNRSYYTFSYHDRKLNLNESFYIKINFFPRNNLCLPVRRWWRAHSNITIGWSEKVEYITCCYQPSRLLLVWSKNQSSVTQLLIDYIPGHHGELCGGELHSVLDDTLTGASLVSRNSRGMGHYS